MFRHQLAKRFVRSRNFAGIIRPSFFPRSYATKAPTPPNHNDSRTVALIAFLAGSIAATIGYKLRTEQTQTERGLDLTGSVAPLAKMKSPKYATPEDIKEAIKEISDILPSANISNTKEELDAHSDTYFNSHHPSPDERPKYVVYPESTEQVSRIMKVLHKYKVPVVPISGASSLEGHFIPTRGGVSMDMSKMDKILKLNQDDLDITVQAGVGWEDLADYLSDYKLFFGPDPGPGADIGGMCATSCSGTNAYRYGTMKENVLSVTVVLADGSIVKTKKRARKSSAGYNLTGLFIGSEGTLGVITEATLKLNVKPVLETVAVIPFKQIDDAARSVNEIIKKGIQLNAIELLDDKMMKCINESGETSRKWTEKPTLFIKIGGLNKTIIDALVKEVREISKSHNSTDFQFATDDEEKTELWSARKVALWSTINQGRVNNPNIQIWTTDAAVPFSNLPKFLTETKEDIDDHGLQNTLVSHIGDGNAHSFILYDPLEREKAQKVVDRMVQRAIDYEGTCTGEHGIGFGKRDFLIEEIGEVPVDLMRKIKMGVDPLMLMNPDKVFKIDPNEKPEYHGDLNQEHSHT